MPCLAPLQLTPPGLVSAPAPISPCLAAVPTMLPPGLGLAAYEGLRFGVCFEGVAMHVQVRRGPSHLHACVCRCCSSQGAMQE